MNNHKKFLQDQRNMSNKVLIELAKLELSKLCDTGGKSFTMRVPAKITDTDMVFSEMIIRLEKATNIKKK